MKKLLTFLKKKDPRDEQGSSFRNEKLLLVRSAYGADRVAVAAGDAGVGVDDIFIVALGDSAYRALGSAGAALDALVGNLKSHSMYPP